MAIPDCDVDMDFIGPPVGWFGRTADFPVAHVSILNRCVHVSEFSDGFTRVVGISPRLDPRWVT